MAPIVDPDIRQRWFSLPNFLYLLPLPLLTFGASIAAIYQIFHKGERSPFILSNAIVILAFIGFAVSLYPYLIPRSLTIWDLINPSKSLNFLMIGVVILVPLLLSYTANAYYVFRGKVDEQAGYH